MDYRGKLLAAPLIWFDGKLQRGVQIRLSDTGKITAIGQDIGKPGEEVLEIQDAVLLPGFVNAHSHAFHRYLRGRSEIGSAEVDTFWKWRDNIYALIKDIDYQKFKAYCYGTFREMLAAGITTVGEFHYVHGTERFSLDHAVIEAAEEAGIRLVLLETLYCRAGFDATDVLAEQVSFKSNLAEFLANVEKLEARAGENTTIGVAAHSFRAVPPPVAQELFQWAVDKKKPFHIHLEEQPKEIEDCERVENCKPSTLLAGFTKRDGHLITAVHCTYTPRHLLDVFAELGVNVCVCPATEGFLGDGIPDLACAKPGLPNSNVDKLCLGTDCNNRISMLEEMRWLAFCQNMKNNRRNVGCLTAEKLLRISAENGASSLGLADKVGSFKEGHYFDFVAFDLNAPRISVAQTDAQLIDALVFGCGNAEIKAGVAGVCKQ